MIKFSWKEWKLIVFYLTAFVGLLIFLKGFFPYKMSSAGLSSMDDVPSPPENSDVLLKLSSEEFPSDRTWKTAASLPHNYTKLVLIVLDGLREDFLFGSKHEQAMPFIREKMNEDNAAGFVCKALAPTITLPRIKTLATGSIPGYVDVLLSLDQAKELKDDNFVRTAFANGKSIVFYGDDTWVRLFPGKFKRHEGIPGFLNGLAIIDDIISGHVEKELLHPDNFDIMILHFMGIDYVGLTAGPKSQAMDSKLQEMDKITKEIYERLKNHDSLKSSKSLIVVTGDHGMTDKGSHGGTTPHERNIPLIFMSPGINRDYKINNNFPMEVDQTDVAATLSLLLGLPIPRSSMGKSILNIVEKMSLHDQLHSMQYNCHQLLSLAAEGGYLKQDSDVIIDPVQLYRNSLLAHATWLKHSNAADKEFIEAKTGYTTCQKMISNQLVSNAASYNHMEMGVGMIVLWFGYIAVVLTWCQVVLAWKPLKQKESQSHSSPVTWGVFATVGIILHCISLLSSSFLEEEHQTWYFVSVTFLVVLFANLMMVMLGAKLGLSDVLQSEMFSKRDKSSIPQEAQNKNILHRARKIDENFDPSWDFIELEQEQVDLASQETLKPLKHVEMSQYRMGTVLICCLLAHRMIRAWNQTGIKYADVPDIGDWFNDPQNAVWLSLLLVLGLVGVAVMLEVLSAGTDTWLRYLTWTSLALIYNYRAATGRVKLLTRHSGNEEHSIGLMCARLVYFLIVINISRALYLKSKYTSDLTGVRMIYYVLHCVILLAALLLKPHNVIVLVLNLFLYWAVFRQLWPVMNSESNTQLGKIVLRTTLCYWFGQMSYFSLGNSNSLSTIDISAGYIGMASHSGTIEDMAVIFLLLYVTYVGPLLWTLLCLTDVTLSPQELPHKKRHLQESQLAVFSTFAFLRLTPLAFYVVLTTAMRYHLFIWSVFAPKLLFESASTFIYGVVLAAAFVSVKCRKT